MVDGGCGDDKGWDDGQDDKDPKEWKQEVDDQWSDWSDWGDKHWDGKWYYWDLLKKNGAGGG